MTRNRRRSARHVLPLVAAILLVGATAWGLSVAVAGARSADAQTALTAGAGAANREDAYRANNAGVTRLEQFDFPAAVAAFRQALTLDPSLSLARLNLGIALFYAALVVCVLNVVGDPGQPAACPPGEASGPPVSSAHNGAGPDARGGCLFCY